MISKIKITVLALLTGIQFTYAAMPATAKEPPTHSGSYNTTAWQGNTKDAFKMLLLNSASKLEEMQTLSTDENQTAWFQLAIITKRDEQDTKLLGNNILEWRKLHPSHVANKLLPSDEDLQNMAASQPPLQIAVLLPESGAYREAAKEIRQGIMNAYYKNSYHIGRQDIKFYDTTKLNIMAAYQLAADEGADFIIGPLQKEQVTQLSKQSDYQIPTLALNYTDSGKSLPENFFEFGLLPEDEAIQVADEAHESGKTHVLLIAPNTEWGKRMAMAFTKHWQDLGGNIRDKLYFSEGGNFKEDIAHLLKINIAEDKKLMHENNKRIELEKQRRQDFDAVVVFATPQNARALMPLLRYYYVRDVPIYSASSILDQSLNTSHDIDFDKVIVCHMQTTENRLYSLGEDAYQLSHTLLRLVAMPILPANGSTGALSLNTNQQIHRRLPCDAIKNGHIQSS